MVKLVATKENTIKMVVIASHVLLGVVFVNQLFLMTVLNVLQPDMLLIAIYKLAV